MELMVLMAADILVIIPVIRTVRPVHQRQIPEDVAVQPVTDAEQRLVIILINPAVHLIAMKAAAIAIPVLTAVAVQDNAAVLVPPEAALAAPAEDLAPQDTHGKTRTLITGATPVGNFLKMCMPLILMTIV